MVRSALPETDSRLNWPYHSTAIAAGLSVNGLKTGGYCPIVEVFRSAPPYRLDKIEAYTYNKKQKGVTALAVGPSESN